MIEVRVGLMFKFDEISDYDFDFHCLGRLQSYVIVSKPKLSVERSNQSQLRFQFGSAKIYSALLPFPPT